MARSKQTRQIMRVALTMTKSAMYKIPLVGNEAMLRFMVRVSRHLPIAMDCIFGDDMDHWTLPCIRIIMDDGRLVDTMAWRCLFRPGVPPGIINAFLDDPRLKRRDWQFPLRFHHCVPFLRPCPRHCGSLYRVLFVPTRAVARPFIFTDLGRARVRFHPVGG